MNPRVRALGETVLRVKDLQTVKRFYVERRRLHELGIETNTAVHRWCQWRSLYVRDPEGNILELVCYDQTIAR